MEFLFSPATEDYCYDNYGSPCRTDYVLDFAVDGVPFTATFSDLGFNIWIFYDKFHIKFQTQFAHSEYSVSEIQSLIREAFFNNPEVNKFFHRAKIKHWNKVAAKLDLSQPDDWS